MVEARSKIDAKKETRIEYWTEGYGDYAAEQIISVSVFGVVKDELVSMEGFIAFSIDKLLQERAKKQETISEQLPPIIIMDFGSTQAHSMVRLAKRHRRQIEGGELILICTNLSHSPDEEKENKRFDGYEGKNIAQINKDAIADYYETAGLIKWINGRVQSFAYESVEDALGRSWPLLNNLSLIQENFVLRHVRKDTLSPGDTEQEKETNAVTCLKSLLSMNGLLVSTDLDKSLCQPIAEPELFNRQGVIAKGRGLEVITAYQRQIVTKLLPTMKLTIKKLEEDIAGGVLPNGSDVTKLSIFNKYRQEQINGLRHFVDLGENIVSATKNNNFLERLIRKLRQRIKAN